VKSAEEDEGEVGTPNDGIFIYWERRDTKWRRSSTD
jgi:hypothetical protein